ncbi:MAG: sigma-70 family RNA polymerase sigma factor [Planctomycetia bacterium]|nr:sigma-70 family RNA polymerase sigma factor [Planctomycetia bacterium]
MSDLYVPLVYSWAQRGGLQASDAADVVQEVFRVVAARIASFRGDRPGDSFRGWLWGITKNKLREHFRKTTFGEAAAGGTAALERLKSLAAGLPDDSSALDDASSRAFIMRKAMQAVRIEFEETTWRAFWRSAVEDQATADIAADLGLSVAAVRQAKYRVLRRLRQELQGLV